ncbi:hypothetical protein [Pseudofrankia inefficax]|uniref:Uncharacterized protein n=1 Tax=Pseudofrankia inefficax (strain DSM 45817 / CECT 9037 / DDB 130130 / EuI1c) TaxID=298654 RepID=E3J665_PSEI1|nr:hypothetical protein [Pseudofrankia inefficax]ADP78356.1 hypothetical protein FraEuI1c_0270 [Pseudofrankia inefficax]
MSAHPKHLLVLPMPCTAGELRAALAGLVDDAPLVDVALAGEDGKAVTVEGLTDVVLVVGHADGAPARTVATPGGEPSPPVATPAAAVPAARGTGRRELARLVAAVPANDARSARQLAEDLAPSAGLKPASARRYLTDLRAGGTS